MILQLVYTQSKYVYLYYFYFWHKKFQHQRRLSLGNNECFPFYNILKDHVFEYFCYPRSNLSIWGFFRIISSCQMWLYFKVVVVGWKKMKLQPMHLFWAATETAVFNESVVVSGAWKAMVWGSEDFSFMGRGLRCGMTLCWESLEVFGLSIIVDFILLLQLLES